MQDVILENSSVNVTSGKLSLTGGGSSTGSSFSISSGATLGFDSACSLNSTSSVTGAGTSEFGSGAVNFQTNQTAYNVTGPLTVDGGTVTFGSGDTVGGTVSVSGGTANLTRRQRRPPWD